MLELLHLAQLVGVGHEHLTERPRVDEPEVAALLERDHDVRVGLDHDASVAALELPAHPEMGHEDVAGVEVQQDVLPATLHLRELVALQARREVLALGVPSDHAHRVARSLHLHRLYPATDDVLLEVASHHLDLR